MDVQNIEVSREVALKHYRAYKTHQHYAEPIDHEIARAYNAIAKGRMVIKALESIKLAGRREDNGYPKLALSRADVSECFCTLHWNGSASMTAVRWARYKDRRTISFGAGTFPGLKRDEGPWYAKAQVPLIPIHLRPKRALENYWVLWEAEWKPEPARDPLLLRRVGKADMWIVLAQWDLTEVERAALATRIALRS